MGKFIINYNNFLNKESSIDEGWKQNLITGMIALSSLTGIKAQTDENSIQDITKKEYIKNLSNDSLDVKFDKFFKSGQYKFDKTDSTDIINKVAQIVEFTKTHKDNNIIINITSSESQVRYSQKFPTLAENRAEFIKNLIKTTLDNLIKNKDFNGKYTFIIDNKLGNVPYKVGENPNQEKFEKDQYVKVNLKIDGKKEIKKVEDNYSAYTIRGERIYDENNHAIGDIYYKSVETHSIKDAGILKTSHQNILFKCLNDMGKYNGTVYLIPYETWNSNVSTNVLSSNTFNKMKDKFIVNLEVN